MLLNHTFYTQNAVLVARQLLGSILVREIDGQRLSGLIVETEAYTGTDDRASHAHVGPTPRNAPMWENPGYTYIYFTYGKHWLLNAVCEPAGSPAAVLLRALDPREGLPIIAANRPGVAPRFWTNGPARLTQAFGISGVLNRLNLSDPSGGLWIESGDPIPPDQIRTGPRIGLGKHVSEPWRSMPWRFWIHGNPHVSRITNP